MKTYKIQLKSRLILERNGEVLLMKQTSKNGGKYTLPGGTIEADEFAKATLIRECKEEVGILIHPDRLELVHTLHKKKPNETRVTLYFKANEWIGMPQSQELNKFNHVAWFHFFNLPPDMSPTVNHVLQQYKLGNSYSEFLKE